MIKINDALSKKALNVRLLPNFVTLIMEYVFFLSNPILYVYRMYVCMFICRFIVHVFVYLVSGLRKVI